MDGASSVQRVLDSLQGQAEILLFQDDKGCVWQIVNRADLSMADFKFANESALQSLRVDDATSRVDDEEEFTEDDGEEEEEEEEEEYYTEREGSSPVLAAHEPSQRARAL